MQKSRNTGLRWVILAMGLTVSSDGAAAPARPLAVVELFQSQGCSSCPPANANINLLADRTDLLVLSFGVTYWDKLGWRDTFASKTYTDRQWAYARGLGHANVGTPQVVINGRRDVVGINAAALQLAISATPRPATPVSPTVGGFRVANGAKPSTAADVWLVTYDPRVQQVAIQRGENGGRTLPHRNIVRELAKVGRWEGAAQTYALPAISDPALRRAVVVQAAGGPVLAAGKL